MVFLITKVMVVTLKLVASEPHRFPFELEHASWSWFGMKAGLSQPELAVTGNDGTNSKCPGRGK